VHHGINGVDSGAVMNRYNATSSVMNAIPASVIMSGLQRHGTGAVEMISGDMIGSAERVRVMTKNQTT
jgi:hypothetical protein